MKNLKFCKTSEKRVKFKKPSRPSILIRSYCSNMITTDLIRKIYIYIYWNFLKRTFRNEFKKKTYFKKLNLLITSFSQYLRWIHYIFITHRLWIKNTLSISCSRKNLQKKSIRNLSAIWNRFSWWSCKNLI